MAMISLRQLLDHAAEHGYGVPAFNVNNLEQIQAILQAAQKTDAPVILQASAGARKYAGEPFLRKMVEASVEMAAAIPGAKFVKIPDCGHLPQLEKPDAMSEALLDWLEM